MTREPTFCEKHLRFWGRICLLGHRIIAGSPDIPISSCPGRRETVDLASIVDVLGRTVVKPASVWTSTHAMTISENFLGRFLQASQGNMATILQKHACVNPRRFINTQAVNAHTAFLMPKEHEGSILTPIKPQDDSYDV